MNRTEFIQAFLASGEISQQALTALGEAIGVPSATDVAAAALDGALLEFSGARPKVATVSGTWAGAAVTLSEWYELSRVLSVESPTGQYPPVYLDASFIYPDADAGTVYLNTSTGGSYKIRYTALHTIPAMPAPGGTATDVSIPAALHTAFFKLSAAGLFERLASRYADTIGSGFAGDAVSYQTKTGEYLRLAKEARTRYRLLLGLPETPQLDHAGFGVELDQADYRILTDQAPWQV